jgi:PKD repeat protein
MLAMVSFAAVSGNATVSVANPVVTYDAGPFFQANQSPLGLGQLDSGPRCDDLAFPCDDRLLTISLPAGYTAAHPFAGVKVTLTWTDSGAGQSDYDLYIFRTPRADCTPNNCTQTDGTQQADHQSTSSGNVPEAATIFPLVDGNHTYTVRINPFQPTGETVHVRIELLPGGGDAVPGFGGPDPTQPGVPRYQNFYAPPGTSAQDNVQGEFNIGFNPKSGRIMTMNNGPIWRLTPPEKNTPAKPECCEAVWEDKSTASLNIGLDPILWTDQKTGRTFAANSTAGANAVYAYSDTDGDSWTEGGASPPNGGADHETIGSGPYPALLSPVLTTPVNQGEQVFYCSQDVVGPASCQRSDTLGASYGPGVLAYDGTTTHCGGLHGHIHVAPNGTAWLPVNQCDGLQGGATSADAGATWQEFRVPGALSQQQGADPSIAIDSDSTAYFAYVNNEPVAPGRIPEGHVHVKVSKDGGLTWINDFDLGASHGIRNAVHVEAVGGSSGRAAVGFFGTDIPGPYQDDTFTGVWYAFISTTYDGGKTWVTVNATPNDPVQRNTGVWQQGGGRADRNLLDFNEITVDDKGRPLYGYSDGCVTAACIAGTAANDYTAYMAVARQTGGKPLFANLDPVEPALPKPPCLSGTRDSSGSHLTWRAPDNGGSNIIKYLIYRGTTAGGEGVIPLGQTVGRTTFLDSTADPAVPDYFYVVKAVNGVGAGIGAASNEIDLKLGAIPPVVLPFSCSGVNVVTDAAGDARNPAGVGGNTDQADITGISFSVNSAKTILTTKMMVKNLANTPTPGTTSTLYFVVWKSSNGKNYATRLAAPGDPSGTLGITWGEYDTAGDNFVSGTTHATTGTYNAGPNGTVTVDVPMSGIGNPTIPISDPAGITAVTNPYGLVFGGIGAVGSGLFFTAPMDRAPDSGFGQKWAVCLPPNAAPTAILTATPQSGPAPLTVTFNGASSADPDAGDGVVSYTFDFGDGSPAVTQASPTIVHTYNGSGSFPARLKVTDSHGLVSTNTAQVIIEISATLRNISTRGNVQPDPNALIGGFIVTGNQSRIVIVRAIGPSIKVNGQPFPGTLQNPTLELHDQTKVIATNDNWKIDDASHQSQETAIKNTGLAPTDDRESAIAMTLAPGQYTAIVRGVSATSGIALVEAYDLDPAGNSKFGNIATRGFVQPGDSVMIGGFTAGPANAAPATVLIRGIGPTLTSLGVPGALQDPTLQLYNSSGTKLAENDDWQQTQKAEIEATGLAPKDSREAAIYVPEIAPGQYTAVLAGKGSNTGVALVEIYNLP